jgi:hypothetical protein
VGWNSPIGTLVRDLGGRKGAIILRRWLQQVWTVRAHTLLVNTELISGNFSEKLQNHSRFSWALEKIHIGPCVAMINVNFPDHEVGTGDHAGTRATWSLRHHPYQAKLVTRCTARGHVQGLGQGFSTLAPLILGGGQIIIWGGAVLCIVQMFNRITDLYSVDTNNNSFLHFLIKTGFNTYTPHTHTHTHTNPKTGFSPSLESLL